MLWILVKFSVTILYLGLAYAEPKFSNSTNISQEYSPSEQRNLSEHSLQDDRRCIPWPYRAGWDGYARNLRLGYCSTYNKDTGLYSFNLQHVHTFNLMVLM